MTPERKAELRTLCEAATPGPLEHDDETRGGRNIHASWYSAQKRREEWMVFTNQPEIALFREASDAAMFAAARTSVIDLLDALDARDARIAKLEAEIAAMGSQAMECELGAISENGALGGRCDNCAPEFGCFATGAGCSKKPAAAAARISELESAARELLAMCKSGSLIAVCEWERASAARKALESVLGSVK